MKIQNVEAVVWDLDGTILDSFHISEEIMRQIAEETGREMRKTLL